MGMFLSTKWTRKRRRKDILLYKELHPLATLNEIGGYFGTTRQYISQFLRSNNIIQGPTKRRKNSKPIRYCPVCKNPTPKSKNLYNPIVCAKCRFLHYNIKVNCAFCHVPFWKKKKDIRYLYKTNYKLIYCSRKCYYKGRADGLGSTHKVSDYIF